MIIEMGYLICAGVIIFIPYLLFSNISALISTWLIAIVIILILIFLFPPIIRRIVASVLRLFGYKVDKLDFSFRRMITLFIYYLFFWMITAIGFYLLVSSLTSNVPIHFLEIASSYSMAWVIGFLAFLTPGGLGVREGALAWMLAPFLPQPLPVIIALVARLWWSIAELVDILIALIIDRKVKNQHGS